MARYSFWTTYIAGRTGLVARLWLVTSLVVAVLTFFLSFKEKYRVDSERSIERYRSERQSEELRVTIARMSEQLAETQAALAGVKSVSESGQGARTLDTTTVSAIYKAQLGQVTETQKQLGERMAALEDALGSSPEKAISVPLLKQQLADTQDRFKSDMDESHAEFQRLYTLVQWALGLIVTVILGIGGFALSRGKDSSRSAGSSTHPEVGNT